MTPSFVKFIFNNNIQNLSSSQYYLLKALDTPSAFFYQLQLAKSSHALFIFLFHQILGLSPRSLARDWTQKKFYFLAAASFDHLISTRSYLRCVKIYFIFTAGGSKNLSAKMLSTAVRRFPERKIKIFLKMLLRSSADFSSNFFRIFWQTETLQNFVIFEFFSLILLRF